MDNKVVLKVKNPRAVQAFKAPVGLYAPRPATLDGKRILIGVGPN